MISYRRYEGVPEAIRLDQDSRKPGLGLLRVPILAESRLCPEAASSYRVLLTLCLALFPILVGAALLCPFVRQVVGRCSSGLVAAIAAVGKDRSAASLPATLGRSRLAHRTVLRPSLANCHRSPVSVALGAIAGLRVVAQTAAAAAAAVEGPAVVEGLAVAEALTAAQSWGLLVAAWRVRCIVAVICHRNRHCTPCSLRVGFKLHWL